MATLMSVQSRCAYREPKALRNNDYDQMVLATAISCVSSRQSKPCIFLCVNDPAWCAQDGRMCMRSWERISDVKHLEGRHPGTEGRLQPARGIIKDGNH